MRGRRAMAAAIGLSLGLCLVALAPAHDVAAQSKKKGEAAKADSAAQAAGIQRAYAAGTKAFEAGDMMGAEQNLSVALAGGGLPNPQMARALYLRGSVYRRTGRPAQAISDLTTAVWLKGGLSEADKAKATEERQLAYREAGLGETPPPVAAASHDQTPGGATPTTAAPGTQIVQVTQQSFWSGISMPSLSMPSLTGSSQPAQTAAAAPTTPAQTSEQSSFWSFLPSFGGSGQPAGAPAGVQPADAAFATTTIPAGSDAGSPALGYAADATLVAQTSAWDTKTAQAAAAAAAPQSVSASYAPPPESMGLTPTVVAAAPAAAPAGQPAAPAQGVGWSNPLAGTGQAVSGFFSNMFGGGTPAAAPTDMQAAEGAGFTTGSTEAGGGWGPESTVVTSQTSSMVQRSPESPPAAASAEAALPWTSTGSPAAPVRAASTGGGGNYKLQVAAVRSREEADRLAQSLNSYPAVRDGTVRTEIDETVIGSMGTFYRVRLGPYASASEPTQLCQTLKPQGFDCLVVAQ